MTMMDAVSLLLRIGFQHLVTEANAEAGVARLQELIAQDFADRSTPGPMPSDRTLHDALAACLRDGLIREPVRLPEGALQCHWRLELTPKGVAAGRALVEAAAQATAARLGADSPGAGRPGADTPATDDTTARATPPTTQTTGAR